MATALFITTNDLKRNTIVDGNVDIDKFIQFIKIAQEIHIQNYLGGSLYNKISDEIIAGTLSGDYLTLVQDYLKDMLIHFAMVDYLPFSAYQVANGGVFKHTSENSVNATKNEIDYLVDKHRDFAQFILEDFWILCVSTTINFLNIQKTKMVKCTLIMMQILLDGCYDQEK